MFLQIAEIQTLHCSKRENPMNANTISIFVNDCQFDVKPGLTIGSKIYSTANIPEEHIILLDVKDEIDVRVSSDDYLILRGDEKFISVEESCLPENPSLQKEIEFRLNGELRQGDIAFRKAKVSTEELASLIDQSSSSARFILDLSGLADQVLPNGHKIIVSPEWNLISTPYEGEPVDLCDCNLGTGCTPAYSYRIKVDGQKYVVNVPHMLGEDILKLAGISNPSQMVLYQKFRGGEAKVIEPSEKVDFTAPGIEKFVTIPTDMTEGFENKKHFQLSSEDTEFLDSLGLPWDGIMENGIRRVIIYDFPLPAGYNVDNVSVNMRLESGYPDVQIDMAYFYPSISRLDNKSIRATSTDLFNGVQWQRWSRHRTSANPWRPGIDNLSTHVSAIRYWLQSELLK